MPYVEWDFTSPTPQWTLTTGGKVQSDEILAARARVWCHLLLNAIPARGIQDTLAWLTDQFRWYSEASEPSIEFESRVIGQVPADDAEWERVRPLILPDDSF